MIKRSLEAKDAAARSKRTLSIVLERRNGLYIKELRVGNFLMKTQKPWLATGGKTIKVTPHFIYTFPFKAKHIHGIRLDSSMIERLGFEWSGGDHYELKRHRGIWIENNGVRYRLCKPYLSPFVDYVHQLQNIVYDLAHTELSIPNPHDLKNGK